MAMVKGQKASLVITQENLQDNIKSVQDTGYSDYSGVTMGNSKAIEYLQAKYDEENKDKKGKDATPMKNWTINKLIAYHYKQRNFSPLL
jgi:hypothetical protein